jgi:hypothetical protein
MCHTAFAAVVSATCACMCSRVQIRLQLVKPGACEWAGRPSTDDISAIQSPFAATMLESLPVDNPRTFQQMFPNASPEATDLVGHQRHKKAASWATSTVDATAPLDLDSTAMPPVGHSTS